jgi:hypothetical protein
MENYVDFFIRKKMKKSKPLLHLLYERVMIQPVKSLAREEIDQMVRNAKKPDDLLDPDEYLPAYNAASHPSLAIFKEDTGKKEVKVIKLKEV